MKALVLSVDRNRAPLAATSSAPGRVGTLRTGEPFNPWRGVCGFYPPDVVSRIGPMVILQTRRKFSASHKLLYALLVRRAGRDGRCFPSIDKDLAPSTGRSPRSVKMALEDLEVFGPIVRRRRGRGKGGSGKTSEYSFLRHLIFEVQERADDGGVLKCKNGGFEVQGSALLKCKNEQPPCTEETRTEETRTSSSIEGRNPATTTSDFLNRNPNPKPRVWTDTEIRRTREAMQAHFGSQWLPDLEITRAVLEHTEGLDDVRLWLLDLTRRRVRPHSWGLYPRDVASWPERREDVARQVRAAPPPIQPGSEIPLASEVFRRMCAE